MKKLLKFALLALLSPLSAHAAIQTVQGSCSVGGVKVMTSGMSSSTTVQASYPKCLVSVYATGTTNLASIFNQDGSLAANPFTANTNASWLFYGTVGTGYDITMSGGSPIPFPTPFTLVDVVPGGSGGGGSGNIIPTPQFRLFLQPNAGTQAVAQGAVIGQNGIAPMLQGIINPDLYATGSGNNGIANALASSQCSGGSCLIEASPTSTDTESAMPTVNNTHVKDYRNGSQADFFLNPVVGPGGTNPYGSNGQGGWNLQTTWNDPNFDLTNGAVQSAFNIFPVFNDPGYYWGANYGVAGSPANHGLFIRVVGSQPAITNMFAGQMNTYHGGDVQSAALYNSFDGAFTGGADEGSNSLNLHRDQSTTWFHGTVNAGATTGTQMLQTTYVAGAGSRPQYAVNGYMLDNSKLVGVFHVAGPTTQLAGYSVFTTPLAEALPSASTAVGIPLTDTPPPANKVSASTTTVFTMDSAYNGSTAHGLFVPGVACMAGQLYQTVTITSVSAANTPAAGQQTVTYTYSKPNLVSAPTSLWQGGPCGDFEVPQLTALNGWGIPYAIIGATDTTHIVGRLFTGSSSPVAIPNNWNASTANASLLGLSISGTTVTATANIPLPLTYNGISGATISGATNSSFNGTTGTITTINGNQLQWTQTGPSGTSASALITLPQSQFGFYLFPGAEVVNSCTTSGCPLSPNTVAWTSGDQVQNMLNPSQRGNAITAEDTLNSPSFGTFNASNSFAGSGQGRGISGTYTEFTYSNGNPCTMYIGCGGLLSPPQGINLAGPIGLAFSTDAPADGSPVFTIRPRYGQQGGATSTNPINLMIVNNGGLAGTEFYNQPTGEFSFSALATPRIRATVLSTGLGRFGDNPVAITSSNASTNDDVMGTYAAVGNETPLDASGTLGAKAYYAGLVNAGASPPILNGVFIAGTGGSSTWTYTAKCVTQFGESLPATGSATTNLGNATLSATNFNALNVTPGFGCQSVNVYRIAQPAGYASGLICANVTPATINNGGCTDKGQTPSGSTTANVDTSGQVQSPAGVFATSLTVAGQNVCQSTGTNCPAAPPIASVGTNGISQPDNSTIGISGGGVLSTKGFSGTCAPTTTLTVVNGVITGCS